MPARPIHLRIRTTLAVVCVAAAGMTAGPAAAQPDRARVGAPSATDISPERLRARIESRLTELRAEEASLESALRSLDEGAPPPRVVREFFHEQRRGDAPREITDEDLTPQRREAMISFLRDTTPLIAERVERELANRPEQADAIFRRLAPRVLPQIELRERDPELFDLRARAMRLDWRIRQVAGKARSGDEEALDELESLIAERVDATLEERAVMLARFERRIESMREDLESERNRRDGIVAEKVAEIQRGPARDAQPRRGPRDRDR